MSFESLGVTSVSRFALALLTFECQHRNNSVPTPTCAFNVRFTLPTYEYHCNSCNENYDLSQSFSAATEHTCEKCGEGKAKRVLHAPRVVFKGSGFYATDSRGASTASSTDSPPAKSSDGDSGSSGESGAGDSGSKVETSAAN